MENSAQPESDVVIQPNLTKHGFWPNVQSLCRWAAHQFCYCFPFAGFTAMSKAVTPIQVMTFLNE